MKKLTTILLVLLALIIPAVTWLPGYGNSSKTKDMPKEQVEDISTFEQAVQIIKKYEGLHSTRHWPLIGYGHLVMPGEKFSRSKALSKKEAEALLRKDLLKNCAVFREYGKDSLLLGVLAYNIGAGATLKSAVVKKLKSGNRNIKDSYLAHCRYKGKVLSGLKKRRVEEFEALFIEDDELLKSNGNPTEALHSGEMVAEAGHQAAATEEGALFASVFSPVRMMLGALSHPFRLTEWNDGEAMAATTNFNQPLSKTLCTAFI
ncbi:MAG: hypothetical protein K2J70_03460 [Muribaculaceae bacterium]|nr:hypothetical protein [Muribaculaceae bacterium]